MSNLSISSEANLYQSMSDVLLTAKTQARRVVNDAMVQAYWQVGRLIVKGEQDGESRAEYSKGVLAEFSRRLLAEFGKGFSSTNLKLFRQFYLAFPISRTLCDQSGLGRLSWLHFRQLLRVESVQARARYASKAAPPGLERAGARSPDQHPLLRTVAGQSGQGMRQCRRHYVDKPPRAGRFARFHPQPVHAGIPGHAVSLSIYCWPTTSICLLANYQWLVPAEDELRIALERDQALLKSAREAADD